MILPANPGRRNKRNTSFPSSPIYMKAMKLRWRLKLPMCSRYRLSFAGKPTCWWLQQNRKTVNVKKGQFLSAEAMKFAVDKISQAGNQHIMLTERATCLDYQDMVVDFRGIRTHAKL
jgi:hypothetical protein